MRAGRLLAGVLLCLMAGCGAPGRIGSRPRSEPGVSAPPASSASGHQNSAQSKIAEAQATHEYPSPPPPHQSADATAPNAVAAIRLFATDYINWTAQTVSGQMSLLAQASIGQARATMQLAAAETSRDYELARDGIANRGDVEAVAPLFGHRYQYVVVTLEQTTATNTNAYQGLQPAWHVTLVTVAMQAPGQWTISGWQPES